jgi:hypothetical protein
VNTDKPRTRLAIVKKALLWVPNIVNTPLTWF